MLHVGIFGQHQRQQAEFLQLAGEQARLVRAICDPPCCRRSAKGMVDAQRERRQGEDEHQAMIARRQRQTEGVARAGMYRLESPNMSELCT